MTFPISIFLYIYFAFLLFWAVFSIALLYHMLKFGFKTASTFFVVFGYLAISIIIIALSFAYISQVDWQSEISVFSGSLSGANEFMQQ